MKSPMSPYLQEIWNRLVRCYRLKNAETGEVRILSRDTEARREGGSKRYTVRIYRCELLHYTKLGYIEFKEQVVEQRFWDGKLTREEVLGTPQHFTVNSTGSIRRLYIHHGQSPKVRTISLRNYYLIEDEQVACLIMATTDALKWVHELPVTYHPVSNSVLKQLSSLDAFLEHETGSGVAVPARLRRALSLLDLIQLIQVVPGEYLNALSATLKAHPKGLGDNAQVPRLILAYYRDRLADPDSYLFRVVYSYVRACRYTETKLNMRVRSHKRLVAEREAVWRKRDLRRVPEFRTRKDLILGKENYGNIQLELINSRKRLAQEATAMKSCVDTYARDIADGQCAIYHVLYRGEPYTLELQRRTNGQLCVNQLAGVGNSPAPPELDAKIGQITRRQEQKMIEFTMLVRSDPR